jgi:hypothetical protein
MRARSSAGAAGLATVLIVLVGLVAGSFWLYHRYHHDRSVAAYCNVFYGQGSAIRSEYSNVNAQSDPIGALGAIFSAPDQLANFFGQLENVAPMTIEPDVATIHQAFQQEANELTSDPVEALLGGLVVGAATSGASNRVNQWTLQNCGPPPGNGTTDTTG